MFDHGEQDQQAAADAQRTVRDDQRPSADGAAVPGTVRRTGPDDKSLSGTGRVALSWTAVGGGNDYPLER